MDGILPALSGRPRLRIAYSNKKELDLTLNCKVLYFLKIYACSLAGEPWYRIPIWSLSHNHFMNSTHYIKITSVPFDSFSILNLSVILYGFCFGAAKNWFLNCCKQSLTKLDHPPKLLHIFAPIMCKLQERWRPVAIFDCCKQSLNWLNHPSFLPSFHPSIHPVP